MLMFGEGGKPLRKPREKHLEQGERAMYGIEPHWWKARAITTKIINNFWNIMANNSKLVTLLLCYKKIELQLP